jgi:hypothetical protein
LVMKAAVLSNGTHLLNSPPINTLKECLNKSL